MGNSEDLTGRREIENLRRIASPLDVVFENPLSRARVGSADVVIDKSSHLDTDAPVVAYTVLRASHRLSASSVVRWYGVLCHDWPAV